MQKSNKDYIIHYQIVKLKISKNWGWKAGDLTSNFGQKLWRFWWLFSPKLIICKKIYSDNAFLVEVGKNTCICYVDAAAWFETTHSLRPETSTKPPRPQYHLGSRWRLAVSALLCFQNKYLTLLRKFEKIFIS